MAMDQKHIPEFRNQVLKDFGANISKQEGLWYSSPEYPLYYGLPTMFFYQKPGDLVLLGPGCLHWVRSMGIAVNSAWNFCDNSLF